MKNKLLIITVIFLLLNLIYSQTSITSQKLQARYNLIIYEVNNGIHLEAENIALAHFFWRSFDNQYIPTKLFEGEGFFLKIGNFGYRTIKFFLTDYPITFFLSTLLHERGHAARALEFGASEIKLFLSLPPPFGNRLPSTSWYYSYPVFYDQNIIASASGSQASSILSGILRKNILLDYELDYHNALLYLHSNGDINGYIIFASNVSDIVNYIYDINDYHLKKNPGDSRSLKVGKLQIYALVSLLTDPINYYAFNSIFNGFLLNGKTNSPIYLIPITQNLKYLPHFGFTLAPYGPELILKNYLKYDQKLFSLNLSHSDGTFANSWRIIGEMWNFHLYEKLSLNSSFQIWNQPNIEYNRNGAVYHSKGMGGAFTIGFNYDFMYTFYPLGLTFQIGYKSKGFIEGENIDNGLILKGGFVFRNGFLEIDE